MADIKKDFIISYDIRDDKRLKKVAKFLERRSSRIQLSVYFLPKYSKKALKKLVKDIKKMIDLESDDVRIYEVDIKKCLYLKDSDNLKYFIV